MLSRRSLHPNLELTLLVAPIVNLRVLLTMVLTALAHLGSEDLTHARIVADLILVCTIRGPRLGPELESTVKVENAFCRKT